MYPGEDDDGVKVLITGIVAYTACSGIAYELLAAAERFDWPGCTINVADLTEIAYGFFGVTFQCGREGYIVRAYKSGVLDDVAFNSGSSNQPLVIREYLPSQFMAVAKTADGAPTPKPLGLKLVETKKVTV